MESMIQYHLARMPMYGAHESIQFENANKLRDNIKAIGECLFALSLSLSLSLSLCAVGRWLGL